MVRALVNALPPQTVRLNAPVRFVGVGIAPRSTGFIVETEDGGRLESRALVFATPAYATGTLMRALDPELAQLCGEVPYVSTGTVGLAFRRSDVAHPLNGSGFVVPAVEKSGILAASWMSSKWPHRAPADRVLMRTFVGGARDPRALDQTDAELVARSLSALKPLLGVSGDPLLARVYRWERASAQHEVGHAARLDKIERLLTKHPGVFITGSGFRGVGIPDCVGDARATGTQVAEYLERTQHEEEDRRQAALPRT
jgi:oxygen-dependent protoporphyrinogen oxidase